MTPGPEFRWVARVFRWGGYTSALLLVAGLGWVILDTDIPIQVGPAMPFAMLGEQLLTGNPYALLQLGLLVLLATPVLSVVSVAVSFWRLREYRYVLVVVTIVVVFAASLWLAAKRN